MCSIPQFRSEIIVYTNGEYDGVSIYPFVSYMIYFPMIIAILLLNCFVDAPPNVSPYKKEKVN